MGPTSGLFLNDKFYLSFYVRHKKCIRYGYIFECELIYIFWKYGDIYRTGKNKQHNMEQ